MDIPCDTVTMATTQGTIQGSDSQAPNPRPGSILALSPWIPRPGASSLAPARVGTLLTVPVVLRLLAMGLCRHLHFCLSHRGGGSEGRRLSRGPLWYEVGPANGKGRDALV